MESMDLEDEGHMIPDIRLRYRRRPICWVVIVLSILLAISWIIILGLTIGITTSHQVSQQQEPAISNPTTPVPLNGTTTSSPSPTSASTPSAPVSTPSAPASTPSAPTSSPGLPTASSPTSASTPSAPTSSPGLPTASSPTSASTPSAPASTPSAPTSSPGLPTTSSPTSASTPSAPTSSPGLPTASSPGPTSASTPSAPTSSPTTPAVPTTCLTRECVELGNQVLASLDEAFDPCHDFYRFACNKTLERATIPAGSQSAGAFETLIEVQQERFKVVMSRPVRSTTVEAVGKAATFFQSCMDLIAMDRQAHASLVQVLSDLGGWPLVGIGRSSSTYNINAESGFLTEFLYGSSGFFTFSTTPHPHDSSRNILAVDQGGLTLPSEVVYQNSVYTNYIRDYIVEMLQTINPGVSEYTYRYAIDDVMEFERALAGYTDFYALTTKPYADKIHVSTLGTLTRWMPRFHWIQNLQYYGRIGGFSVSLNSSTPVNILAPSRFLIGLNSLIASTDATTLQNYAKWHLLFHLLPLLSRDSSIIHHSILNIVSGIKYEEAQRYKTCVSLIEQLMPFAMARAFTEEYYSPGTRENISVIVTGIRAALKQRISEKGWLDSTTKQRALSKVDHITDFFAYPDLIYNNTKLNSLYSRLEVSTSVSYFVNYIKLIKFTVLNVFGRLSRRNGRDDWNPSVPPTLVNAEYYPLANQIYILEGILDTPFFRTYWPDYFKFGTIGLVIGHELVHGFDNNGRKFDESGNFMNWWSSAAVRQFNTRAQCFINQYNQYSLPAGRVNGTQTLGENIADNGGLAIAYRAYKNRGGSSVEQMLPGLNYTSDQLFFIASAQPWCEVATEEAQEQMLKDIHTPSPLRPLGFLSNSPEFAAAFNCHSGSRMNPTHKCEIW